MKKCSTCKTEKAIDFFGKDKSRKDRLSTYCKPCAKNHRDNSSFDMKAWRAERKDSLGEYFRNYYAQNKTAQVIT